MCVRGCCQNMFIDWLKRLQPLRALPAWVRYGLTALIVLACFASNLHRIQQVCDAAAAAKRKVAIVGRSMVHNVEAGRRLGHLDVAKDQLIDVNQLDHFAPHETVVVCTGSRW